MQVHPFYDTEIQAWVVGDLIAKTLRELKTKLPPRTQIVGYYPNGYVAEREGFSGDAKDTRSHLRTNYAGAHRLDLRRWENQTKPLARRHSSKRTDQVDWTPADYAELARLVSMKVSNAEIAERMSRTKGSVVGKIYRRGLR